MAIVKITPAGEMIKCKAGEHGRFQFNVSNSAGQDVRFSAQAKGSNGPIDWLTVDGEAERTLTTAATSTVEVAANPPATLLKMEEGNKRFNFKLRVSDADNPSDTVDSATVSVEVIPVPPPPKKFPWWIVILIAVIIIVGITIWQVTKDDDTESGSLYSESENLIASENIGSSGSELTSRFPYTVT